MLEHPEGNEETLKKILENNNFVGEPKVVVGNAGLEEDVAPKDKNKMYEYMDAHGLLLEL